MKNIESLSDLAGKKLIIYGAGSTGREVYSILRGIDGITITAFCDTHKSGVDARTGLEILSPADCAAYNEDHMVVIGVFDVLKPDDCAEIHDQLTRMGFPWERVLGYAQIIRQLCKDLPAESFYWQHADESYDWNTNIVLVQHISRNVGENDKSLADLGAGGMTLRNYLRDGVVYYPVDYKARTHETIVCDFNKKEFPNVDADVYVLCAMLYYMDDPKWLLAQCARFAKNKIIVALLRSNMSISPEFMRAHGHKNAMYFDEISLLLGEYGFTPSNDTTIAEVARRYIVYSKDE
ncbi:MAG: hypothetical protein LBF93_11805 [Zoogloeaceae bacterium]|nr:hypothetical protein [Zoogloeaceae bacterium]